MLALLVIGSGLLLLFHLTNPYAKAALFKAPYQTYVNAKGNISIISTGCASIPYPYLISGDQFSVLYPRNLDVFYGRLLDPNTARSDRQSVRGR